jgi:hypothetical protein
MSKGKHVKLKRSPNTPTGYGATVAPRVREREWRREGRRARLRALLERRTERCRGYVLMALVALGIAACAWVSWAGW